MKNHTKNTNIKRLLAAALVMVLILSCAAALSGCKKKTAQTEKPASSVSKTTAPKATPPAAEVPAAKETEPEKEAEKTPSYKYTNPYTGLGEDTDVSGVRPYAVMINNNQIAIPQWGITKADIMFEMLTEGGITRMMGIYSHIEDAEIIGSIRSSRPYFLDLMQSFDAIYIHAGGSDEAYELLSSRNLAHIDGVRGTGEAFHRDPDRKKKMGYEHSLMLDTEKVFDVVKKAKYRTEIKDGYNAPFAFSENSSVKEDGADAVKIKAVFSSVKSTSFNYDEKDKLYYVSQFGGSLVDEEYDSEKYAATNVICIDMSMKTIDSYGRMSAKTTEGGSGHLFCRGKELPITWSKKSVDAPFVFKTKGGEPLELAPGKTYICVIAPSFGSVSFE